MMATHYGGNTARLPALSRATDGMLDELSQQLATIRHQNRYASRAPGTQYQGGSMRVVKPRSAHNSPGSAGGQGRRRALVNDYRFQAPLTRPVNDNVASASQPGNTEPSRSARPFSWHPSTQFVQQPDPSMMLQPETQQQYQMPAPQYPVYTYIDADYFTSNRQLPPTPAVYSGYTSPASAFSPLSLPTTAYEQQLPHHFPQPSWATMPELSPPAPGPVPMGDRFARTSTGTGAAGYSDVTPSSTVDSWNSFASHGFGSNTAPPTPEDFVQAQQAEPRLQSEESIPYQPLEDEEEDKGEILYGMGLYDTPEKPIVDAQLEYHRTAISSLLGSTFTPSEATGKGLKLEDAWEPPASDDEGSQAGDDDEDDDAQGDSQDN